MEMFLLYNVCVLTGLPHIRRALPSAGPGPMGTRLLPPTPEQESRPHLQVVECVPLGRRGEDPGMVEEGEGR